MNTPAPAQIWADIETLAAVPGCSGEQQLARALMLLRDEDAALNQMADEAMADENNKTVPAPVAGEGSLLLSAALALVDMDIEPDDEDQRMELAEDWKPEARAAILAVADWAQRNYADPNWAEASKWAGWFAARLRREVES